MKDQLGAFGLALNAVVLWNSLYLDRAAKQLAANGFPVTDDLLTRLSPRQFEHINFVGRHAFFHPRAPCRRQLRDPAETEQTGWGLKGSGSSCTPDDRLRAGAIGHRYRL